MTKQSIFAFGIVGGLLLIISSALLGNAFGFPGSSAYEKYELYNRLMGFGLLLSAPAIHLAVVQRFASFKSHNLVSLTIAIGLFLLVLGTNAEFWLFSDLPYAPANMRSYSFATSGIGFAIVGLTSLLRGSINLLRSRENVKADLSLVLLLPLAITTNFGYAIIGAFASLNSIFMMSKAED